jgi:transposase InsO family protein
MLADLEAIRQGFKLLSDHGDRVQQSQKGNSWDNAPTESFYGKAKVECAPSVDYADHDEANMNL